MIAGHGSIGPIGSNPALPTAVFEDDLEPATDVAWLASGRDALALAAQAAATSRWFVPDFICAAVPDTLRRAGAQLIPYTAGQLAAAAKSHKPGSDTPAALLLWDLGWPPADADQEFAAEHFLVVEDRCQWVGLPHEVPKSTWAIGSLRKWAGGAGGGWLVGPEQLPQVNAPNPAEFARVTLAASALRSVREQLLIDELEPANVILNRHADQLLGVPTSPRRASRLARLLAIDADPIAQRAARARVASAVAAQLRMPPIPDHAIGLRTRVQEREQLRRSLQERRVLTTVHWADGDWCGRAGSLAATTLTIPIPALTTGELAQDYATTIAEMLAGYDYEF